MRRAPLALAALALLLGGCLNGTDSDRDGGTDLDAGPGDECTVDTAADDCSDGDPCTEESCENGYCAHARMAPNLARVATLPGPSYGLHLTSSRVHVAAGAEGVRTFDLGPLPDGEPTERFVHPTAAPAIGALENSGQILAFEGAGGLEVFANSEDPAVVASYRGGDEVRGLGRVDDLAVVYAYAKGLEILDAATWTRTARVDTPGRAQDAVLWGDHIFVADGLAGLTDVDFSDRTAPEVLDARRIPTEGRAVAVARRDRWIALAETGAGAGIVDLRAEGGPARIATLPLGGDVLDVDFTGSKTAAWAAGEAGLVLVDLLDPEAPSIWTSEVLDGPAVALDARGERVAVSMGEAGTAVYDLQCTPPETP